jgi:hypothetical protein
VCTTLLTGIGDFANERTSRNRLAVELDVNGVWLGLLGREVDETTSASQDLNVIWHFSVVDGNLKLTLSSLRSVNPELTGLADHPVTGFSHTY